MGILLTIAVVIGLIIALALVLALFVKKDYTVVRDIVINKNKQEVFDYIRLLKNQDNYSKWGSLDPNMKKEYRGMDGTEGFTSLWEGNNKVGKGEQKIVKIIEGERIDYELHFIKPFEGMADSHLATTSVSPDQTRVSWGMSSSMKYPMNLMLVFMNMEKLIGNDFSTGLSNLKQLLESR